LYCAPDIIKAIYKTTNDEVFQFKTSHLLLPGNTRTKDNCNLPLVNNYCETFDSYSISGNKLSTNFSSGKVYLVYYSNDFDCNDNQLIPDSYRIKEFIKAYLKQKLFEQIFNMSSDESFNQSLRKYEMYKQMADEAYILADIDEKKETVEKKIMKIRQTLTRHNKFHIP
jgi:disulfide oxidoreductase YuzD